MQKYHLRISIVDDKSMTAKMGPPDGRPISVANQLVLILSHGTPLKEKKTLMPMDVHFLLDDQEEALIRRLPNLSMADKERRHLIKKAFNKDPEISHISESNQRIYNRRTERNIWYNR